MCGRYAAAKEPATLVEEFVVTAGVEESLAPRYNVAPTTKVYAVLERPPRDQPDAAPQRRLAVVRWGLVPSWAKDASIGNRMINARLETVAEKASYRKALSRRRCLLPADGYYEWYTPAAVEGGGKPRKQPFYLSAQDGSTLAFAGLYELWRDPSVPDDDPQAWRWTTTILTTAATPSVAGIHERMPVILPRESWDAWLDPSATDTDAALALTVPERRVTDLRAWPVSTAVNKVGTDGPELREPLPVAEGEDTAGNAATLFDR